MASATLLREDRKHFKWRKQTERTWSATLDKKKEKQRKRTSKHADHRFTNVKNVSYLDFNPLFKNAWQRTTRVTLRLTHPFNSEQARGWRHCILVLLFCFCMTWFKSSKIFLRRKKSHYSDFKLRAKKHEEEAGCVRNSWIWITYVGKNLAHERPLIKCLSNKILSMVSRWLLQRLRQLRSGSGTH